MRVDSKRRETHKYVVDVAHAGEGVCVCVYVCVCVHVCFTYAFTQVRAPKTRLEMC